MPVGTIIDHVSSYDNPPPGYLFCDGTEVSRTTYAKLFAVIGESFGSGNGSSTFNLPDGRGKFKRGVDYNTGNDPDASSRSAQAAGGNSGDNVGSIQGDSTKSHSHHVFHDSSATDTSPALTPDNYAQEASGATYDNNSYRFEAKGTSEEADVAKTSDTGDNETRPINFYINYFIKY